MPLISNTEFIYVDFIRRNRNNFQKSSNGNLCAKEPWIIRGSKTNESF